MDRLAPTSNSPTLHTVRALCKRFGIDRRHAYRALRQGELSAYLCGGSWPRTTEAEFVRWIRSTRVDAGQGAR